jgi:hypothetical protein
LWDNVTVTGFTVNTLIEAVASLGTFLSILLLVTAIFTLAAVFTPTTCSQPGAIAIGQPMYTFSPLNTSPPCRTRHRSDVAFIGRAPFLKLHGAPSEFYRANYQSLPTAKINIGVFAGTLESHPSVIADASRQQVQKPLVYPFSERRISQSRADLCRRWQYQRSLSNHDNDEKLLGAYAGCLAGGTFDELGPRYAILGEIEIDSNGKASLI